MTLQKLFAMAVIDEDLEEVRALLDQGADVNAPFVSAGETALQYAAELSLPDMAELLLARGAVSSLNVDGLGPLHLVAHSPARDAGKCARVLLAGGLDVNQPSRDGGKTPLAMALFNRRNSLIQAFLDHGATVDRDAMVNAVNIGDHADTLRVLIERGGDLHMVGDEGEGLMHMAARVRAGRILTYLIEQGLEVDALNETGETPLQLALVSGEHFAGANDQREAACCALLDHGAKLVTLPKRGLTSLLVAARDGLPRLLQKAIAHGDDPNHKSDAGWTALHLASMGGHKACAQLLLEAGVDATTQNENGETPGDVAGKYGYVEMAAMLTAHVELQELDKEIRRAPGGKLRI